jgi:hypothetical protein
MSADLSKEEIEKLRGILDWWQKERLRVRLSDLEAKVEALERLPRPAVTVFRDPRTND